MLTSAECSWEALDSRAMSRLGGSGQGGWGEVWEMAVGKIFHRHINQL